MTALFTTAMALREVDADGVYRVFEGELNKHWTIGPKVHGGAMVALCANAARTAHGGPVEPVAVSASFLWAPDPGPMRLVTSIRKRGRRISVVDVELIQGDRAAVHAVVTLGEPEHLAPPLLSANPAVGLMDPEPPDDVAPIGPGHRLAGLVNLAEGCDVRTLLSTLGPTDGRPPVIQNWVRPRGLAPDVLFALMCGDVSAPVSFAVNRTGWAPTVQLTAYLRGAAGRRLVAGGLHLHADRAGLVRRGPHRRRLRGPHRGAEPASWPWCPRAAVVAGRRLA